MKRLAMPVAVIALGWLSGCGSGMTQYTPQLRARGELTPHYDNGFSMTAEGKEIASGNTWGGLTDYVECVPRAKKHAERAEAAGAAATVLSIMGGGIGIASFGGLAGVAVYDKDPNLGGAILGIGVAAAVTGVVLAAIGRHEKNVANGNAIDAMNYYNDAVGSYGGTCKKPAAPLPEVEPTKVEKPQRTPNPEEPANPDEPTKPRTPAKPEEPAKPQLTPDQI